MNVNDVVEKVLIDQDELKSIVKGLADKISDDYKGKKLLVVGILKGAVLFMSDILKELTTECEIDFISASSYNGTQNSGVVSITKDLSIDPKGYDVLLIEDILESGATLGVISDILHKRGANSVKFCVLLDKPECRKTDITADYIGKTVSQEFVVGYGLDYDEKYRNLPFVGILKKEFYCR